jgi:glycosyltransferase involved in cell wall biosynthesis
MKPASIIFTRFPYASQLGGEEIHTFAIAEHLRKIGHKPEFLTSCRVLIEYARNNDFKVRKIWMYKPPVTAATLLLFTLFSPLLFIWGFVICAWIRLTRKNPYFYSLSFTEKLIFSPWCFLFRIPMIWIEHARIGNWFHKNPWKFWYQIWENGNDVTLVTVSKIMQQELGIPSAIVIPNAIPTEIFKKLYDVSILPEKVQTYLREHKFDIGYVGRLTEDKGMEVLLKLKQVFPEVGIITIGSGEYKEVLEENGIRNYPFMKKEQVACFMQNIQLLVLPATKTDPFGLVVIEAIAAGTPVLISDQVGIKDYLVEGQEVLVSSIPDFEATIGAILKNPTKLEKLRSKSEKAIAKFDYSKMLDNYANLFQ